MIAQQIHIIGAGGVGMSGLALLAKRMGAVVTASDQNDSPYLQKLSEKGIVAWVGSQPERIPEGAHVFYSTAIKPDDAERSFAERSGFRCESRHSLLALITKEYFTIAVAGCHGKTTTSAWTARLLEAAGYDPTALIGGTVPEWNSNYREGRGSYRNKPLLVIEADESDRSFLSIAADVAMITNIDLDHTDVHASLDSLRADFRSFAEGATASGGWVHVSKECDAEFIALQSAEDRERWQQVEISAARHELVACGHSYPVGLPGKHNLLNASLVLQLASHMGIAAAVTGKALSEFTGVNRRMQKLAGFRCFGLDVIDDYAHHPHEVAATLSALSGRYERLMIFWEPHRLSRFNHFYREFAEVLQGYADKNLLYSLPVFASGDKAEDYPETEKNFAAFKNPPFQHIASPADFLLTKNAWTGAETAAVFMGAGNSSVFARQYTSWLETLI